MSGESVLSALITACRYISVDKPPPACPHSESHHATSDPADALAAPEFPEAAPEKKRKRKKSELEEIVATPHAHKPDNEPAAETVPQPRAQPAAHQKPAYDVHSTPVTHSAQHVVEEQPSMHEYQVVTSAHSKPHALLALLAELKERASGEAEALRAIVFASAVDAARRLTNLLQGSRESLGLRVFEMSSRVASRVQLETIAALQREASWCCSLLAVCCSKMLKAIF